MSVHVHAEIAHGWVKRAFAATLYDHPVVIKQARRDGVDSGTLNSFLPAAKLFKEAIYLHHMACAYPSSHIAFYGICIANEILESFYVMGRGVPLRADESYQPELDRLKPLRAKLADLKREQFVKTASGHVALIDWGDVLVDDASWGYFDKPHHEM